MYFQYSLMEHLDMKSGLLLGSFRLTLSGFCCLPKVKVTDLNICVEIFVKFIFLDYISAAFFDGIC